MENVEKKSADLKLGAIFVITGVLIGLLLTMQFKSSIPASTFVSDEIEAQKEIVDSFLADQSLLKNKIVGLRETIAEKQDEAKIYVEENNLEKLKQLKNVIGLESMRGPGVLISLDDGPFIDRSNAERISQSLINASDLRDVVNLLRAADAEAISINDQRIIATTPITSVGNTILVNNFHLLPPFDISAIGEAELILQRLDEEGTLTDLKKRANELKINMDIEIKDGLMVPAYNGNLSTKYLSKSNE
ncbi:DUF881 domain-containing protein [Candidatus Peregrinibacteria bacterium]|nr:DUF881 domain-containing protein [Candidatus Peregrinibacteria bacterium]